MLLTSMILLPVGLLLDQRLKLLVVPSIIFVCIFSFLPHKELRFIIYTIPILNTAIGVALAAWYKRYQKSRQTFKKFILPIAFIIANMGLTVFFVAASKNNYPGAEALLSLKTAIPGRVYVGNMAAQTGVTRFLEDYMGQGWIFNKTEGLSADIITNNGFDFLLMDYPVNFSGCKECEQYTLRCLKFSFGGFERNLSTILQNLDFIKRVPSVAIYMKK
ncbi:hypothetical protein ACOME3_004873 [Neoechinorhynchus agilis]